MTELPIELWNGLMVGHNVDQVRSLYPNAKGNEPFEIAEAKIFKADFAISAHFDSFGLYKIQFDLFRCPSDFDLLDFRRDMVWMLSQKYGRGQPQAIGLGIFRKKWLMAHKRIELVCAEFEDFPTVCIEYKKAPYAHSIII